MTRLFIPVVAVCARVPGPALADVDPTFLPNLTFPAPAPQPDTSTQSCVTQLPCT